MHPQLTLSLDTAPATSFGTFHVDADNELVRQSVEAFADGALEELQLYLWGDVGTGKSHLLQAACLAVNQNGYRTAYLPGELANQTAAMVGLEHCELVCIDDLQRLDHAAEVDLFHCINRCREQQTRLLFAADRSPDELGLRLPDLQTRLAWGPQYQLQPLDDGALRIALRHEIEARSLEASDEVLGYVLRRYPRSIATLKQVVDRLDDVSLSEQRRITIPFIKSVFGDGDRAAM